MHQGLKALRAYEEEVNRRLPDLIAQNGVFAANWIAQAKAAAAGLIPVDREPIVTYLCRFLKGPQALQDSTTALACAMHGLLAIEVSCLPESRWEELVRVLFNRQQQHGGFSYYPTGKPLFRLDVTSHVVEMLLLWLQS